MKKKSKIVFLDAGTVDYGGISFSEIEKLGQFKAWFQTSPSQVSERIRDAAHVISNKFKINADLLTSSRNLRCIHLPATGFNNIDIKTAKRLGIGVTNVSGYCSEIIAQFTFGFLLSLAGNMEKYNRAARDGHWSQSPFFMYAGFPIVEIRGKTLGILGYGTIGRRVAEIAKAFGMKVLIAKIPGKKYSSSKGRLSFERVIRESDFFTIHAALSDLTEGLINARVIRMMKKGAFLINMARGAIWDEKAVAQALKSGHVAGAACDVLTVEPPPKNHPLMKVPNFLMTPHSAWASLEARKRLVHEVAMNIRAFQKGAKRNRVV